MSLDTLGNWNRHTRRHRNIPEVSTHRVFLPPPLDSTDLEPFCPHTQTHTITTTTTTIPPRMFIAQKIISLVISAPLWAAINFSSLHDGPACGHRSLTFSKRSINLSVHPATYPLMFSSSPIVFFFLILFSGCRLLGGKVSLSLCALQNTACVCLSNYSRV